MRLIHHDRLTTIIQRGLAYGAERLSTTSYRWDTSGRCQRAHCVVLHARPNHESKHHSWSPGLKSALDLELVVPCRQCEPCRLTRSWLWRHRAKEEIRIAPRTWFGTLTFKPSVHTETFYRELGHRLARGSDTSDEEGIRISGLNKELTKYWKRLRFNTKCQFRYLLVSELHKSGLPHFHALIHEIDYLRPLRKIELEEAYGIGFTNFKLVDDAASSARYVCKYIAKEARGRVRASQSYGVGPVREGRIIIPPSGIDLEKIVNNNDPQTIPFP